MTRLGIMQGRLVPPSGGVIQSFPRDRWSDEFPLAAEAGLDSIEWIYDSYGMDVNPIRTEDGVSLVRDLAAQHKVKVASVCADYFMDRPLVRADEDELDARLAVLVFLLARCRELGAERLVVPFVDNSRIDGAAELRQVVATLRRAAHRAADVGVAIHVESALSPEGVLRLMSEVNSPFVRVTYDAGNSASLGYEPDEEFAAYGAWVGSVHVKDRIRGGGTVPLGDGDADLPRVFRNLEAQGFEGDIILQVARGPAGQEVSWARHNRDFVMAHLPRLAGGPR